jgi:hypothetical protein
MLDDIEEKEREGAVSPHSSPIDHHREGHREELGVIKEEICLDAQKKARRNSYRHRNSPFIISSDGDGSGDDSAECNEFSSDSASCDSGDM